MVKQAGRKTGQLSYGSKRPRSKEDAGLDWNSIREARARRLEEEYERGIRNPDTIEHHELSKLSPEEQRRKQKEREARAVKPEKIQRDRRPVNQKTGRKKGPRWDIDEGVRLYTEENMMPKDIATKLGVSYETVIKGLKFREVFELNKFRARADLKRPPESYSRQKYCGVCGADLDAPGNSRERFKKKPDGTLRPNGRECVPCCRRRTNESYQRKS